jgi:hypothetical protein
MASLKNTLFGNISFVLPKRWKNSLLNNVMKPLKKEFEKEVKDEVTDKFIELLLYGMSFAFFLSDKVPVLLDGYKKNIEGFNGKYAFKTKDKKKSGFWIFKKEKYRIAASAIFKNGKMKVKRNVIDDWDVCVTFKNGSALRAFILSGKPDILDSLLENSVETDGNLNYINRLGFLTMDLAHRFGM